MATDWLIEFALLFGFRLFRRDFSAPLAKPHQIATFEIWSHWFTRCRAASRRTAPVFEQQVADLAVEFMNSSQPSYVIVLRQLKDSVNHSVVRVGRVAVDLATMTLVIQPDDENCCAN